jgi:hypothetical protein
VSLDRQNSTATQREEGLRWMQGMRIFLLLTGGGVYTDKKENHILLMYKEIQNGAVAKSYMTTGLLINGKYLCISVYTVFGSPSAYMTAPL